MKSSRETKCVCQATWAMNTVPDSARDWRRSGDHRAHQGSVLGQRIYDFRHQSAVPAPNSVTELAQVPNKEHV